MRKSILFTMRTFRSAALITLIAFTCVTVSFDYAFGGDSLALRPRAQRKSALVAEVFPGGVRATLPNAQTGIAGLADVTHATGFVAPVLAAPQILELFFSGELTLPLAEVVEAAVAYNGQDPEAVRTALDSLCAEGILTVSPAGEYDLNIDYPGYHALKSLYSVTSQSEVEEKGKIDIVTSNAIVSCLVENAVGGLTLAELQERLAREFFIFEDHTALVLERLVAAGRVEQRDEHYYVGLTDPLLFFAFGQQIATLFGATAPMVSSQASAVSGDVSWVDRIHLAERLIGGFGFVAARMLIEGAYIALTGASTATAAEVIGSIIGMFISGLIVGPLLIRPKQGVRATSVETATEGKNAAIFSRQADSFYKASLSVEDAKSFSLPQYDGEEDYEAYRAQALRSLISSAVDGRTFQGVSPIIARYFYDFAAEFVLSRSHDDAGTFRSDAVRILDALQAGRISVADASESLRLFDHAFNHGNFSSLDSAVVAARVAWYYYQQACYAGATIEEAIRMAREGMNIFNDTPVRLQSLESALHTLRTRPAAIPAVTGETRYVPYTSRQLSAPPILAPTTGAEEHRRETRAAVSA